jgi:hypothetical protein
MPARMPQIIKFFRGGRIAIPLAAVGIIVFIVLGGHQKILGFAVSRMAEFLLGAGDLPEQQLAEHGNSYTPSPAEGNILSSSSIISKVAPSEALAGEAGELAQAPDQPEPMMEAAPDTAQAEPDVEEEVDARTQVVTAYTATFLRDPFYSLVAAGAKGGTRLLDVSGATMVGSVWGESGIIALLEDDAGKSYALRVGDRVVNGSVVSVTPASIAFSITIFGLTKSVTLELAEEGEW